MSHPFENTILSSMTRATYNVLIVDDSPVIRTMMRRALNTTRAPIAQVHEASSGAATLELLATQRIDLILCDLKAAQLDRNELIRLIHRGKCGSYVPVVLVSSAAISSELDPTESDDDMPDTPSALTRLKIEIERVLKL